MAVRLYIKSTLNHCKTNNGRNFRLQNSHLLTFPHRQKKSFQERRLWQIFQLSIFVLSREKCHRQGHRTSLSVSDTNFLCFSSHNPDWDWWGLWQSCTKDKWLISSWLAVSNMSKIIVSFSHVLLRLFSRMEMLV